MKLEGGKFQYVQDMDTCGIHGESINELEVEIIGVPGPGGVMEGYIVLSTKRWALNADELPAFCEELVARLKQISYAEPVLTT